MSDNAPKNFLNLVPDSINNAAKNLTDLPSKGIGQTLSDCWYLIFGGISQVADKRRIKYAIELEKYKKELEVSLNKVPKINRREPSTQIIMSALEESKYCIEEDTLRKLFVTLLTSSTDTRKIVHPSFPSIIRQMSPDDAKLLSSFKPNELYPLGDIGLFKEDGSRIILKSNILLSGSTLLSEDKISVSISSLIHLGMIQIPFDAFLPDQNIHSAFETSDSYMLFAQQYPEKELFVEHKIFHLTSLGELFISCCFDNSINEVTH